MTANNHPISIYPTSTSNWIVFSAVILTLMAACSGLAAQETAVPQSPNVIPVGTRFLIQLSDRLDTRGVKAGDRFHALLAEDLVAADGAVIPRGRKVKGHVSAVEPGFHTRLLLSFDEIETNRGWLPLIATVTDVSGEHGLRQVGEEGEIERRGMDKQRIAEAVIVGASDGAAEGAHSGGKRGAATGAGNGAADSALSAFESEHDLVLEKGTVLELRLDRNLKAGR